MLERTRKKLRQADFFLQLLTAEHGRMTRAEAADFNLSAFLSAARSVIASLRQEYPDHYEEWLPQWYLDLSSGDRKLLNICVGQPDVIQSDGALDVELTDTHASLGQFLHNSDTQELLILVEAERSTAPLRREITVPALCREYLDLLKRLVAEFEQVNLADAAEKEQQAIGSRMARRRI